MISLPCGLSEFVYFLSLIMQLSTDVMNLVRGDSIVRLLMSLTCHKYRVAPNTDTSEQTTIAILRDCSLQVIQRLRVPVDPCVAARMSRIDLLRHCVRAGIVIPPNICEYIVCGGWSVAALRWARANGFRWSESTCAHAARGGHLLLLQWARANGCPWDEAICACAAENGHLLLLQWARANGCPWDEAICACAAENGHLLLLQWAHANGCPWDETTTGAAFFNDHDDIFDWCVANGCPNGIVMVRTEAW
jgi:hypothetical protein